MPLFVSSFNEMVSASLQHKSINWHLGEHAGEGEMLAISLI
jgi:hypothetical protein